MEHTKGTICEYFRIICEVQCVISWMLEYCVPTKFLQEFISANQRLFVPYGTK